MTLDERLKLLTERVERLEVETGLGASLSRGTLERSRFSPATEALLDQIRARIDQLHLRTDSVSARLDTLQARNDVRVERLEVELRELPGMIERSLRAIVQEISDAK